VLGGAASRIKRAATTYFSLFNPPAGDANAAEGLAQLEMTVGGTLSQLRIRLSAAAGGAGSSYTFHVRKNGANTGVQCTTTAAQTACSDSVDSIVLAAGDLISVDAVPSATQPTDNLDVRWTAKYVP
jgi:hypothetical protein